MMDADNSVRCMEQGTPRPLRRIITDSPSPDEPDFLRKHDEDCARTLRRHSAETRAIRKLRTSESPQSATASADLATRKCRATTPITTAGLSWTLPCLIRTKSGFSLWFSRQTGMCRTTRCASFCVGAGAARAEFCAVSALDRGAGYRAANPRRAARKDATFGRTLLAAPSRAPTASKPWIDLAVAVRASSDEGRLTRPSG